MIIGYAGRLASMLNMASFPPITGSITRTPAYPLVGQELGTIYIGWDSGYTPSCDQSIVLSTSITGGNGVYSYQWQISNNNGSTMSNISGATSSSYTWSPTISDATNGYNFNIYTFICLITDSLGNIGSVTIRCNIVNPWVGTYQASNVYVVHKINNRGSIIYQSLSVSPSQVAAKLSAGDSFSNDTYDIPNTKFTG